MNTPEPPTGESFSVTLDADGRIAEEWPCRGCQYILRGMMLDANCPECGTSVKESTASDLLRFAPHPFLRQLHLGLWMMLVAAVSVVLFQVLVTVMQLFLVELIGFEYYEWVWISAEFLWLIGPELIFFLAVWWLTAHEFNSTWSGNAFYSQWSRYIPRGVAVSVMLLSLLTVMVQIVQYLSQYKSYFDQYWMVGLAISDASILAVLIVLCLLLFRLAFLARRIPSDRISKWLRRFAFSTFVLMFLTCALLIVQVYWYYEFMLQTAPNAPRSTIWSIEYIQIGVSIVYGICWLILYIGCVVMIIIFLRHFRRLALLPARSKLRPS